MSVLSQLASALGRRDEKPNQLLAAKIAKANNRAAVKELVANLCNGDRAIQSDCIKVLYEVGEQAPDLIADYAADFGQWLGSKNNRLAWGAMTALDAIASVRPKTVHALLPQMMAAANSGSVIARDHAVGILIKLACVKSYADECGRMLMQQLKSAPANQFPMYAEQTLAAVNNKNRKAFQTVLENRLESLPKESQKKRIAKVIRQLQTAIPTNTS